MLPLLYVVRMDVEPDYLDEFVKWYDTRHGPDLINTGFHSCNAYHARLGDPLICNVYEVPDVEIFSSDAYVAVRHNDTQLTEEVLNRINNRSNTTYEQVATAGIPQAALGPGDRPSRAGAVTAPVVSTLRLDIDSSAEAAFRDWFIGSETSRIGSQAGLIRSRLARQHGKHPLFPSSQPEWIILSEWATLDEAIADGGAEDIEAKVQSAVPGATSNLTYNVAALSATLLNAGNWAV
jgi:hypothetical protein